MTPAADAVTGAVADRVAGKRASRMRAVWVAIIIGVGAAVLAYRLLRSGSRGDDGDQNSDQAP